MPVGVALALLAGMAGAIISACYDIPRPACGFVCGPSGECPDGYRCASEHYCHRDGASDSLVCRSPDAALPVDAAPDGMPDGMIDAGTDAIDAAPDAIDAAPDAVDAAPDAIDAAPDAASDDAAADAPP